MEPELARRPPFRFAIRAILVVLLGGLCGSARVNLSAGASATASGSAQILSARYVGGSSEDRLISAQTDHAGYLYLFAQAETLPAPSPNVLIVPGQPNQDPNFYCVVHKRFPAGAPVWSVYFAGFSLCEAMGVDPIGDAVHLGMQSRSSNFGGFAQLLTVSGIDASSLAIGNISNTGLGTLPGRPTTIKDIRVDRARNVYVLYDQLINADSELQARLLKIDAGGSLFGPIDIGRGSDISAVALAVDEFDQAFIVGTATSLTTTPDAFQPTRPTIFSCPDDGFLVRVDTRFMSIAYASYLGGTACDSIRDVTVAPDGKLYLYGTTTSADFPMAGLLHAQPGDGGPGVDGFIVRMDLRQAPAAQLQTGTFLGLQLGDRNIGIRDSVHPLVILRGGTVALSGTAQTASFPLIDPLFDASGAPGLARFLQLYTSELGALLFSSHLDSSGTAEHSVLASPGDQTVYAVTQTDEDGLAVPPVAPAGGIDLLASHIDLAPIVGNLPPAVDLGVDRTVYTSGTQVTFEEACGVCSFYDLDGPVPSLSARVDGGAPFPLTEDQPTFDLPLGHHVVTIIATDDRGAVGSDTVALDIERINTAPVLEIAPIPATTATSPDGAQVGLVASAIDPDGDPLTITWTGPFPTVSYQVSPPYNPIFRNAYIFVRAPIGHSVATLTAVDSHGLTSTLSIPIEIIGFNTGPGFGAIVQQVDDNYPTVYAFTPGRMTFEFDGGGPRSLTYFRTRTDQIPPPPVGKQLGSAPYYYDVGNTVGTTGPVRVCADITAMSFARPSLRMFHLNGAAWADVTNSLPDDAANHQVCGAVAGLDTLDTFAVFTDADEASRIRTLAGTGAPFVPGYPGPGDGGPATAAAIDFPHAIAFDPARQYMYLGDSLRLRRIDLRDNTITTIAGTGDPTFGERFFGQDARLSWISVNGLAVDRAGNVFIDDVNACGVLRIDTNNILTRVAGRGPDPATLECSYDGDGGPAINAGMGGAARLAFDSDGNLFVTQTVFGAPGTGSGIAIRRVAAGPDHLVTGTDPFETISTVVGGGTQWFGTGINPRDALIDVSGFAFNTRGDLYIAGHWQVARVTPAPGRALIDGDPAERISVVAGQALLTYAPFQGDQGPASQANFLGAWDVAVLPNGDLAIADDNRIRLVTTGGDGVVDGAGDERISTIAGFSANDFLPPPFNGDGYALSTALGGPRAIVADPRGGVVIGDSQNNRVRHLGVPSSGPGALGTDLSLIVIAAPNAVEQNGVLAYSVSIRNNGPSDAPGVTLSMPIEPGVEVIVPELISQCSLLPSGGGPLRCVFDGSMPHDFSWAFVIRVKPTLPGTLTTQFTVSSDIPDTLPANNTVSPSVTVTPATLVVHIDERIQIRDVAQPRLAVMVPIAETIRVVDDAQPRLAVQVPIAETIRVLDATQPRLAVMVPITERIAVHDGVTFPDGQPPVVTPPPDLVVGATEAGGARGNILWWADSRSLHNFLLAGSAADDRDPSPVRLAPTVSGGTPAGDGTLFPVAISTPVTFGYRDAAGNVGTAVANVFVAASLGGAVNGPGTFVGATTSTGDPTPITVFFDALLQPGLLRADILTIFRPLVDFTPLSAVYDVVSTALLPPGTGIVVAISGAFPPDAVLLHDDGTGWQDVTTPCGPGRVCGRVFSLSPFVVARRNTPTDTTSPVVTPPASLRIPAATSAGVRPSEAAALAAWLAGGTATDADPVLTRLDPTVNGQPVTSGTVFPIGSTTVTFRFRDRAGNIGSATSIVTVFAGTPSIAIRLVANGTVSGTRKFVDLDITNTGDGHARNLHLDLVLPLPVKGFGLVKVVQPPLPKNLGSLEVGATRRVRIELDVPATVKLLSLTEVGHFQNVQGRLGVFGETHKFVP